MTAQPTQIVILGGGYVSVYAYQKMARRLRTELKTGKVQITVVCPLEHHVFHGWTAESLIGILRPETQESRLTDIMPKAQLLLGKAERIDSLRKQVFVKMNNGTNQTLPFHQLLIATGSADSTKVKGCKEFGYQVKCREAFQKTKERLVELVAIAATESPERASRLLRFTVVGAGFTGVEMIANIAEYVLMLKQQYPTLKDIRPGFYLINGAERILPHLQPRFARLKRYTEKQLLRYGVEVLNNQRIQEITAYGAVLDDGSFHASSMVISTIGQSRIVLEGTEQFWRDTQQRVLTNKYLQIKGFSDVWGGGDACLSIHPVKGYPCPSNALWAIKQGEHLGRNIAQVVKGKRPSAFWYPGLGQSASLGLGKGITEIYNMQFTGVLAWVMRWFFFHYFMTSYRSMFSSLNDWWHLLRTGKRIGLSPSTTLVNEARMAA
ncbi:MAG: FAD-dependent oxidoreductase [Spirosomataceae bacterium]